jgi:phosphonoacetate hydrolase
MSLMPASAPTVSLQNRTYTAPRRPVVVVCADGCDPAYIERGLDDGILPNLQAFCDTGFTTIAEAVVPTFTNPNNLSIVTGAPQSVHGISGNYFLDPLKNQAVMLNDPAYVRCDTLPAVLSHNGCKVVIITAKDKLRRMLGHRLRGGICFSAERAAECTMEDNGVSQVPDLVGRQQPEVYSADVSLFVLDAGLRLLERERPDFMYLSLSDYVQHKHAPGHPEATAFYHSLDMRLGEFAEKGALVALTADHGMNFKPRMIFLQEVLDKHFGPGTSRVICPITDPYVVHHGALGSFVRVYCPSLAAHTVESVVQDLTGIAGVYEREQACTQFGLPPDREGDLVVIGDRDTAIGTSAAGHDLSQLGNVPLRSHGGLSEQQVPFIVSEPVADAYAGRSRIRNFDVMEYVLNGTQQ